MSEEQPGYRTGVWIARVLAFLLVSAVVILAVKLLVWLVSL